MPSKRGATVRTMLIVLVVLVGIALFFVSRSTCLSVGLSKGVWLDRCPDGDVRQTLTVNAPGLKRGVTTTVTVSLRARYVTEKDSQYTEALSRFVPTVAVVADGKETLLPPKKDWTFRNDVAFAEVSLPELNDGQYTLRTRAVSPFGEETLDLPLPLFTPARVHVLTDRPLYEPGNTVQFRALALKGSDLTPLEERPGTWRVTNPQGEVVLEERAPSGRWGVVTGSFPLDGQAPSGEWTVAWESGAETASRFFTVKPFTLPRFRVEASPVKPWYRRGERPVVRGTVRYASGAPVADAAVDVDWDVAGDWPPPLSWSQGTALPAHARTARDGTFELALPAVPDDLVGVATLRAGLSVTDSTGDHLASATSVLLSEDGIAVDAVTELPGGGLVQGANNRLFLRATTPAGRVLEGVTLQVKRLWEPTDKGTSTVVDEDGVGVVQVDPGPPVNVVIPALPFRPPPPAPKVMRLGLETRNGGTVSLADRLAFDRLEVGLAGCAKALLDQPRVTMAMLVLASGKQQALTVTPGPLGRCVEQQLARLALPAGTERFLTASWQFTDVDLPKLQVSLDAMPSAPVGLQSALNEALSSARDCLPTDVRDGDFPRLLLWKLAPKSQRVDLTWVPRQGGSYSEALVSCVTRLKDVQVPEQDLAQPAIGTGTLWIRGPAKYTRSRPRDTVMTGYEFLVTARSGTEELGHTRLRMQPGQVPDIRLRASQQIVNPGDEVTVEILRGPDFTGELPKKLVLSHASRTVEAEVKEATRAAQFKVPAEWHGWAGVQWGGGQVFLFIRPRSVLALKVTPEKPRYAPGEVAHLAIETTSGGAGGPAAVGLFGVDDSLSQLVPLPGADELSSLQPQVASQSAFGALDAQALSLGRIRGANAAAATLTRVSSLPPPPVEEASVSVSGSTQFDPNADLVDRFYGVLGALYEKAHAWETSAPETEKLTPERMAKLWGEALDAVAAKKEPITDGWGRKLRLSRLPPDLLALTDPRQVAINGTRLPEDTRNWAQWVAKEKP